MCFLISMMYWDMNIDSLMLMVLNPSGFDFPKGHLVSVADMLRMKLVPSIIDYHEHLRKKIITYL